MSHSRVKSQLVIVLKACHHARQAENNVQLPFLKNLLYWSIVDLQFYASFCTAKWISYIFTYIYIFIFFFVLYFACCFNFYNVVLVSVIWHCKSATIIHTFPPHSIPSYHHRVPAWAPCAQKQLQPLWRTVWRFLKKLGINLLYYPAMSLLGIYPEKTIIEKDPCTPMFIAALFTIAFDYKKKASYCSYGL